MFSIHLLFFASLVSLVSFLSFVFFVIQASASMYFIRGA